MRLRTILAFALVAPLVVFAQTAPSSGSRFNGPPPSNGTSNPPSVTDSSADNGSSADAASDGLSADATSDGSSGDDTSSDTDTSATAASPSTPSGASANQTAASATAGTAASSSQGPRTCAAPTHRLSAGSTGIEVANLQIFLAQDASIYPSGIISGYYGQLTVKAVQQFQTKFNIVTSGTPDTTGFGAVGPKTLAMLAQAWTCHDTASLGWFKAQPISGTPNNVFFSAQASSSRPLGMTFTISFGDGKSGSATITSTVCRTLESDCSSIISASHTYDSSGTYTATLVAHSLEHSCSGLPVSCVPLSRSAIAGTVDANTQAPVQTMTPAVQQMLLQQSGASSGAASGTGGAASASSLVPALSVTQPYPGAVITGSALTAAWTAQNAPTQSSVVLSLKEASSSALLGAIVSGQAASGTYSWTLPASTACTGSAIQCIAQAASSCSGGGICALPSGAYRIHADLYSSGVIAASADSAVFAIGSNGAVVLSTLSNLSPVPSSGVQSAGTGAASSASTDQASSILSTLAQTTTGGTASGAQCLYAGVSYNPGITLSVNCADVTVPGQSCGSYSGLQLTCRNGQWVTSTGAVASVPNVSSTNSGSSCRTPWQSQLVANGQQAPYEPFFSNGQYSGVTPMPMMQCTNGAWQKCDWQGANCSAYTQL